MSEKAKKIVELTRKFDSGYIADYSGAELESAIDRVLEECLPAPYTNVNRDVGVNGKLRPCPWCGTVPVARKIEGAHYSLVGCDVAECPSADAMTPEQWNTRVSA